MVDMDEVEYRLACYGLISEGRRTPAHLIEQGIAQRLNVIFDIDHTLIHSVRKDSIVKWPQVPHFEIFIRNYSHLHTFNSGEQ